jgi:dUTP pyrophosphatase
MAKLLVKRLSEAATLPTKGSQFAAGYDLYASESKVIPSKDRAPVKTDIAVEIPYGYYGRVASRSGLAFKNGIDAGAGVVDPDYRGEVMVLLFNHANENFVITQGDRIAQLIIEKCEDLPVEEVEELHDTIRGEAGFGSTGMRK